VSRLGAVALLLLALAAPALAQTGADPVDLAAAKKEAAVTWYTSTPVGTAQKIANLFQAETGIKVELFRSGGTQVLRRFMMEQQAGHMGADVLVSSDPAAVLDLAAKGLFVPFKPDGFEKVPAGLNDPDGRFVAQRVSVISIYGRTDLFPLSDMPKTWDDLLSPRFKGKLVTTNPSFTSLQLGVVATMAKLRSWEFFEKLAKQKVMQVQSGVDPPKKVALGERAVMVDGADYIALLHKDQGAPIEVVYPVEGAPLINSPNAVFKAAPNPNAARLFQNWMCSGEGQQALVDLSAQYVPHTQTKPKPGRRPLADIKFMKDDPAAVLTQADAIKAKYTAIFKV
jgi:iron(III) transport system substrate-binding protein